MDPTLGLMLFCHHLEVTIFEQGAPCSHCTLSLIRYVAGPAPSAGQAS